MATRSGDDSLHRLRAAIRDLAAGDAVEVVAEARADARARVRSMLTDAMSQSLLASIEERLSVGDDPDLAPVLAEAGDTPPMAEPGHDDTAWYVYGVVGSVGVSSDDGLLGIDGSHPVTTLHEGSLAAVVSRVPAGEFEDARLRENLGDMEWVEKLARAHEEVLETTRRHATVIPMRMCTVYKTDGGVREMLGREARTLQEALEHLDGRAEWGVKVFADPAAMPPPDEDETEVAPPSGAAYMDRRRRDLERKEEKAGLVQEAALKIHEHLCELAVDGLVAPAQRSEATGHRGEMVLNGVYLVEDASQAAFDEAVSSLQDEYAPLGLDLVLTGPWPPYNFVPGTIGATW